MFRVEINVEKVTEPVVSLQKAEALYEEFKLQFPEQNTPDAMGNMEAYEGLRIKKQQSSPISRDGDKDHIDVIGGDMVSNIPKPESEGGQIPYQSEKSDHRITLERQLNDMEVQTEADLL